MIMIMMNCGVKILIITSEVCCYKTIVVYSYGGLLRFENAAHCN
jgi:hypothetical protein